MKIRDKSCMASDTKKALAKLHEILDLKAKPLRPSALEGCGMSAVSRRRVQLS
jgi:hypothetical protein